MAIDRVIRAVLILAVVSMPTLLRAQIDEKEEGNHGPDLSGRTIEKIVIETEDVFNTSSEEEDNWLFDLANRLHIDTRQSTILSQLVIESGEPFSAQKLDESERLLRQNAYLFDATVTPVENSNGNVDVVVTTRDNWTFFPEVSISRAGGESETVFGLEEQNLFGTGTRLNVRRENDEERTSSIFEFSDRNIGRSWVGLDIAYSDLSDGESQLLKIQRPFFSLDTKWAAGGSVLSDIRIDSLFSRGERSVRFREDQNFSTASFGISEGLVDGWTKRWSAGYVTDDVNFEPISEEGLIEIAPQNRRLHYPFLRYQQIQNQFEETINLNQIGRTEDLFLGAKYDLTLGYASEDVGSDREAWLLKASYSRGYGSPETNLMLVRNSVSTRLESGDVRNAELFTRVEYYRRQGRKQLFYAVGQVLTSRHPDLDNPNRLGGDTGLRGYPLNYLNAETIALLQVEQRFYTDYYPLRLYRIGAAVFFDAAQGWGPDATGFETREILTNIGFGLRLGSTRSGSNRIFHVDVAFPLNGDSSIDSVQFQITAKRSF